MSDNNPTTPELLDKFYEIEAAATPGPWHRDPLYWTFRMVEKSGADVAGDLPDETLWPRRNDAQFITSMRNLFRALLDVAKASYARDAGDGSDMDIHHLQVALDSLRDAMQQEVNRG